MLPVAGLWQLIVPAGLMLVPEKQQTSPGTQSAAAVQVTTTPVQATLAGWQVDVIPPFECVSQHSLAGTGHGDPLHMTDRELLLLLETPLEPVHPEYEVELYRVLDPDHQPELDTVPEL